MILQNDQCSMCKEDVLSIIYTNQAVIATNGTPKYGPYTYKYDGKEEYFKPKTVSYTELIGKTVIAFTAGYETQYYMMQFVVGGIEPRYKFFNEDRQPNTQEEADALIEKYGYVIVDNDGNDTSIFCDKFTDSIFCCSDADRETSFIIL